MPQRPHWTLPSLPVVLRSSKRFDPAKPAPRHNLLLHLFHSLLDSARISIPGAVDVRGKELEDNLYGILQQQHQRISLFIRSKTGEIERRLGESLSMRTTTSRQHQLTVADHLRKQTTSLTSKPSVNGRIPAKRLERYGRLEADILK